MQLSIDDFLKLRAQLPVVDVRSEGEYQEGHVQAAVNIPILNNAERVEVGTDYKRKGQAEAIKTGFRLVGPRLLNIINETERVGNELLVHCWRGGMRSSNFCQFVGMAKIKTHQLAGGYKAYRTRALESFMLPLELVVVSGCTGSGKSEMLRALKAHGEQVIDLEQLASHKGSVFGGLSMPPQPTTEQFQNDLFENILKLDRLRRVWIEDESIAVGKIFLPEGLWRQMNESPIVEIVVDRDVRIQRLVEEYGPADREQFLEAMTRITKKLGGQHFNAARDKLLTNDMPAVIDILLTYYDKAYTNGLSKKKHRVKASVAWNGSNLQSFAGNLSQAVNQLFRGKLTL
ncbi:MAG TPA: tRNA 2-selenouridine(34) synthase MnmH [Ohtaekwangia sp.]|uniref:tRNA 2-selenouridine(34) synthase MnmH n=1 Tax=Ohtaekwangia sp. TaxID=2066019 RepID=UPI002F955D42